MGSRQEPSFLSPAEKVCMGVIYCWILQYGDAVCAEEAPPWGLCPELRGRIAPFLGLSSSDHDESGDALAFPKEAGGLGENVEGEGGGFHRS